MDNTDALPMKLDSTEQDLILIVDDIPTNLAVISETLTDAGFDIAIATGASWCRNGFGANALAGIANLGPQEKIYTPDDIMAGNIPHGPTLIYDDDHYYMGSVVAELVKGTGVPVTLATPEDTISTWGGYTYDRWRSQTRLMEMDVILQVSQSLISYNGKEAIMACNCTGRETSITCEALVLVTARKPNDQLYQDLIGDGIGPRVSSAKSISRIGDCDAPAIIAAAVFSGHRYARELEEKVDADNPLKYDRVFASDSL